MKLTSLTPLMLAMLFSSTANAHPVGHYFMNFSQYLQHVMQHTDHFLIIFSGVIVTGLFLRKLISRKH